MFKDATEYCNLIYCRTVKILVPFWRVLPIKVSWKSVGLQEHLYTLSHVHFSFHSYFCQWYCVLRAHKTCISHVGSSGSLYTSQTLFKRQRSRHNASVGIRDKFYNSAVAKSASHAAHVLQNIIHKAHRHFSGYFRGKVAPKLPNNNCLP